MHQVIQQGAWGEEITGRFICPFIFTPTIHLFTAQPCHVSLSLQYILSVWPFLSLNHFLSHYFVSFVGTIHMSCSALRKQLLRISSFYADQAFFSCFVLSSVSLCTAGVRHSRYNLCICTHSYCNSPFSLHPLLLPAPSDSPQLQSLLRVTVSQVQVDECVRADCKASGGCSTQLSISNSPTLVDSGALSLVSVKVTSSAVCGCAAREMTHQPCSAYPSNPCLNGGTCINTQNGYR